MHLFDILKIIETTDIVNLKKNRFFSEITSNSKNINKNSIFIYDSNSKSKLKYVKLAIENNTPAVITNKKLSLSNTTQFIVKDIFKEKEKLLKLLYGNLPSESIAITGTNGKSSVAWYISKIFNNLDLKYQCVGTLGYYRNGKKIKDLSLTTPAYEELYKYGTSNKKTKQYFIFEASSHALDQNRLGKFPVNIAAITNISNDHLDYHKTMSNYLSSKMKLFFNHLSINGFAIINSRIKNIEKYKKKLIKNKIKIVNFGKNHVFFKKNTKELELQLFNKKYKIKNLKLQNDIELENLECAIACCICAGLKEKSIIKALPKISNPPGRLQKIYYKKKNSLIIIDYAHTPDALKKILTAEKSKNKKPIVLFGCGGNRDILKRKLMGKIAFKLASKVYITDDNPRNENPNKIRKQILKYCPGAIEVANRKKAITKAINSLNYSETLIIAGKGHEKTQIIKNKIINFDDYKIVNKIISK